MLAEFVDVPWDYVITVCDRAQQVRPVLPGAEQSLHWGLDDPSDAEGTDEEKLEAFRRSRFEFAARMRRSSRSRCAPPAARDRSAADVAAVVRPRRPAAVGRPGSVTASSGWAHLRLRFRPDGLGMYRTRRILALAIGVGTIGAACSGTSFPSTSASVEGSSSAPAASPANASATQRNEGGQVTVEATWNGPSAGAVFDVKLDTHMVDLDALDLSNAVLRNDRGETMTANPWDAPKGGHHRGGTLTFSGNATAFFRGATSIELILKGVGDVPERILTWQVSS